MAVVEVVVGLYRGVTAVAVVYWGGACSLLGVIDAASSGRALAEALIDCCDRGDRSRLAARQVWCRIGVGNSLRVNSKAVYGLVVLS